MRRLPVLSLLVVLPPLLLTLPAHGYQYWNDIRHSALLPDSTVVVRVENPTGSGEENDVLYEGAGIQELQMTPIIDGPSTLSASVPGAVTGTRYYGFRLTQGSELDFMPVRVADGTTPVPDDLTRVATDVPGDETFGYSNLDLVDCRMSFSGTKLYASLTNMGGGFPVNQFLTFFGYLLGIADPTQADPDTVFALMQTYEQAGIISPGLYKIVGTGLDDLQKLGEVTVQEFPALNTLMLSCELSDLMSDPYFMSWYDPSDPTIGVAGFTQRITLLGGAQEADRSPGGRCYLREFSIEPGANELPELTGNVFAGEGATATAEIDYVDLNGHCPVLAEIVFDGAETFPLYPQSTDYWTTVTYVTDPGIAPLANGMWTEAVFRFSDNETDIVEVPVFNTGVGEEAWPHDGDALIASISPSPFGATTTIDLSLPAAGRATVAVYDLRGALVRRLADGEVDRGPLTLTWDGRTGSGREVGSGIYFVRAEANGRYEVRKIVCIR
ncbi:MAG: T9SS type A sorting domain-containing protein [Candidatus Eisenbacteria bacterium]|nr:T9SS type A sorting domain-containing protein [Candidatus Eisenbacteria bacterium]